MQFGCACEERAWHAPKLHGDACSSNIKSYTKSGIASRVGIGVLIPIAIVV